MLKKTIAIAQDDFTLTALWNGEQGDEPGGTEDMVAGTRAKRARGSHLDAKLLLR